MSEFKKIHAKRLEKLANFLDNLEGERFNFAVFFSDESDDGVCNSIDHATDNPLIHDCGTVACAFGWATAMPEFRQLGLHMAGGTPKFNGKKSFDAAMELFGLTKDESWFLFDAEMPLEGTDWTSPKYEASAGEVANHIRKFVSWKIKQ